MEFSRIYSVGNASVFDEAAGETSTELGWLVDFVPDRRLSFETALICSKGAVYHRKKVIYTLDALFNFLLGNISNQSHTIVFTSRHPKPSKIRGPGMLPNAFDGDSRLRVLDKYFFKQINQRIGYYWWIHNL